MKLCWMFLLLLGGIAWAQSTCKDNPQSSCVPVGHSVLVPCPAVRGEDFRFGLRKNNAVIYNHTCDHINETANCRPPYSREVELHRTENGSISFNLTAVNVGSHGVYRCEVTVLFPPPLRSPVFGAVGIVLIEGYQCEVNIYNRGEQTAGRESREPLWIWILVLVPVIIYGAIFTILTIHFWVKLKANDSNSDYMNTKPRAPRGHRKNRGVQNPAPRYF